MSHHILAREGVAPLVLGAVVGMSLHTVVHVAEEGANWWIVAGAAVVALGLGILIHRNVCSCCHEHVETRAARSASFLFLLFGGIHVLYDGAALTASWASLPLFLTVLVGLLLHEAVRLSVSAYTLQQLGSPKRRSWAVSVSVALVALILGAGIGDLLVSWLGGPVMLAAAVAGMVATTVTVVWPGFRSALRQRPVEALALSIGMVALIYLAGLVGE